MIFSPFQTSSNPGEDDGKDEDVEVDKRGNMFLYKATIKHPRFVTFDTGYWKISEPLTNLTTDEYKQIVDTDCDGGTNVVQLLPMLRDEKNHIIYGTQFDYEAWRVFERHNSVQPEEENKRDQFGIKFIDFDENTEDNFRFKSDPIKIDYESFKFPRDFRPLFPRLNRIFTRVEDIGTGRILTTLEFILMKGSIQVLKEILYLLGLRHFKGSIYEVIIALLFISKEHIAHHPRTVDYITSLDRSLIDTFLPKRFDRTTRNLSYIGKLLCILSNVDNFTSNIRESWEFLFKNLHLSQKLETYLSPLAYFRYFFYLSLNMYGDLKKRTISNYLVKMMMERGYLIEVFKELDIYERTPMGPDMFSPFIGISGIRQIIEEFRDPLKSAAVTVGMIYPSHLLTITSKLN